MTTNISVVEEEDFNRFGFTGVDDFVSQMSFALTKIDELHNTIENLECMLADLQETVENLEKPDTPIISYDEGMI
jgi:hypothetical protein